MLKTIRKSLVVLAAAALLAGCGATGAGGGGMGLSPFSLVRAKQQRVAGGAMLVSPSTEWNEVPRSYEDINRAESWTLNGPYLDMLSFLGGVEHGKAIVRQRRKADRKVPAFRSDMTAQEIAEMIESLYMIRLGSVRFDAAELKPRTVLGSPGFQLDYSRLGGDEVERRGRAVGAVINGRLYLMVFDAAQLHYFDAGLPEFEHIVETAALRRSG